MHNASISFICLSKIISDNIEELDLCTAHPSTSRYIEEIFIDNKNYKNIKYNFGRGKINRWF